MIRTGKTQLVKDVQFREGSFEHLKEEQNRGGQDTRTDDEDAAGPAASPSASVTLEQKSEATSPSSDASVGEQRAATPTRLMTSQL